MHAALLLVLWIACGAGERDSAEWWSAPATDADADGFGPPQDCDETDPTVHPGAPDLCDGIDQDCDGEVDEDFSEDGYEPNDAVATDLGAPPEGARLVFGWIFPAEDVDTYAVELVDDDWSWFSLEAWLYGVPSDADYNLEIRWVEDLSGRDRGVVATADDAGLGGYEVADWGGDAGADDSGRYEIRVASTGGSGCASPYTLQIEVGGW